MEKIYVEQVALLFIFLLSTTGILEILKYKYPTQIILFSVLQKYLAKLTAGAFIVTTIAMIMGI